MLSKYEDCKTCSTHLNIRKIRKLTKMNSGLSTKIDFTMVFSDNKQLVPSLPAEAYQLGH